MQYRSVTVLAPAKLNLSLDVVGTLPNGYHDLDMVMQTIDLYEKITLRRSNDLSLTLPGSFVPANDKNTAVKAALAFFHYTGLLAGVDMTIYKRVPVRAGMAGGSADAAGVLVGLNELYDARPVHERTVRHRRGHRRGCAVCAAGRHLPRARRGRPDEGPAALPGLPVRGGDAQCRCLDARGLRPV